MGPLHDFYFFSSILGFVYIVGSALLGGLHMESGDHGAVGGHDAGDMGLGEGFGFGHDAGHAGLGHAIGHHHAGLGADIHAAHSAGVHDTGTGIGSHGSAGGHSTADASTHSHGHGAGSSDHGQTGHQGDGNGHARGDEGDRMEQIRENLSQTAPQSMVPQATTSGVPTLYLKLLEFFSPTKAALFLFLFGAIGIVSLMIIPSYLSLAPALVLGWFGANLFFKILGSILMRMGSSTNFRKESLIGAMGQLTLSITAGGTGEVMIRSGGARYTGPAKSYKSNEIISKLSDVIIVDIKDGIYYVEAYDQEQLDDSFKSIDKSISDKAVEAEPIQESRPEQQSS